ncbi:DinB family protein [Cohnella soli]|uniref:DinB family protein n=1 Tax=Cohnella soli TaxID=425005 RepID=A0ABW0HWR1_9BACL
MSAARAASIQNYLQTATKIRDSVQHLTEEQLTWKPGPGKWSISEIVGHLLDSNIVNSYRIRKIISEPVTPIVTFAHEEWTSVQRFNETEITEFLEAYDAITRYNALLLRKLDEEQWLRFGMKHEDQISIAHIIDTFICNHVNQHLGQIERNKAAYLAK